ncbi:MAG: polysaccharide biosynthesis protein [Clostridia bacterium]|nr:polysaccharide biosynthesis protein [Clostridia bacterium]
MDESKTKNSEKTTKKATKRNDQRAEKNGKGSFLKGAAWIAAGGFIAKVIGALYRIPLTNLVGAHGLGLYQMVYPVYCLLLTVSATGIPSSIAKLVAERVSKGESDAPVFKTAMWLFLLIGLFGTALMAIIAPFLARAQGSEEVLGGYYALAPSVLFVSAISVFRGWFQGRNRMFPTALSEITEQAVKVGFGLLFAYLYRTNIQKAVVFLLLSVSLSELCALILMYILYKRVHAPVKMKKEGGMVEVKTVLRLSIPVTLSSMLLPLSGLIDSVFVPRLLGAYAAEPVTLFGLFSGGAVTIINLPVSVCYGIAAASIPAVAAAAARAKTRANKAALPDEAKEKDEINEKHNETNVKTDGKIHKKSRNSVRKKIGFSLLVTVAVALPSALGLYVLAEPAVKIVFRNLTGEELTTLVRLVKIFSISALTLSCVQTLSACLTAQGKPQYAAFSMLIAVAVKTTLYAIWLKNPKTSVFGLAHATNICYLVAFLLDLLYNLRVSKKAKRKE